MSTTFVASPIKGTNKALDAQNRLASCLTESRLAPMKTVIATAIMLAHSWYPGACCHD